MQSRSNTAIILQFKKYLLPFNLIATNIVILGFHDFCDSRSFSLLFRFQLYFFFIWPLSFDRRNWSSQRLLVCIDNLFFLSFPWTKKIRIKLRPSVIFPPLTLQISFQGLLNLGLGFWMKSIRFRRVTFCLIWAKHSFLYWNYKHISNLEGTINN